MGKSGQKGLAALLPATLFFAFYGVFVRWIGTEFGVFFLSWARSLIIICLLATYIFLKKLWKPVSQKDYKWFILMNLSGVTAFISYFVAILHLQIATTLLVYYASLAVSGYALGYIVFQEQLNKVKITSLHEAHGSRRRLDPDRRRPSHT